MRRDNTDEGEVFEIFAQIARDEKMLEKTASYDSIWGDGAGFGKGADEVDLPMEKLAGEHAKLYGVTDGTGEGEVKDAHPKGGTTTQIDLKVEKGLAHVETIVERAKMMKDIALGTPTGKLAALIEGLAKLAAQMEEAGFEDEVGRIDVVLAHLDAAITKQAVPAIETDNGGAVGGGPFDQTGQSKADQWEEARRQLGIAKKDISELPSHPDMGSSFNTGEGQPGHYPGWKEHAAPPAEPAADQALNHRQQSIHNGNVKAQQLLNKYRSQSGLPPINQTGVMDATFNQALSDFGIEFGSYKNWNELYSKIQEAGKAKAHEHAMTGWNVKQNTTQPVDTSAQTPQTQTNPSSSYFNPANVSHRVGPVQ